MQQRVFPRGAGTQPLMRETVTQLKGGEHPQRVKPVVHYFARACFCTERISIEQKSVPSYSGFQSSLLPYT